MWVITLGIGERCVQFPLCESQRVAVAVSGALSVWSQRISFTCDAELVPPPSYRIIEELDHGTRIALNVDSKTVLDLTLDDVMATLTTICGASWNEDHIMIKRAPTPPAGWTPDMTESIVCGDTIPDNNVNWLWPNPLHWHRAGIVMNHLDLGLLFNVMHWSKSDWMKLLPEKEYWDDAKTHCRMFRRFDIYSLLFSE